MASTYPNTIDTTGTFPTDITDDTDSKSGTPRTGLQGFLAQLLSNQNDALRKIETELGILPKGAATDLRTRLEQMERRAAARGASTANITIHPGGASLVVDGVTYANGERILLKDQTASAQNGVYTVAGVGTSVTLTRATDLDTSVEIADAEVGVSEGTVNADTRWRQITSLPITLDTTALRWTRIEPPYPKQRNNPWAVAGDTTRVLGETCDREVATALITLATAATHLCVGGIVIPAGRAVTNVNFHYNVAAATITIYYVSLIRATDRSVLATSANATGAWAAAPATKTTAFSSTYTPDVDTPVYVGIALACTTAAQVDALAARAATSNYARAPILVGNTTTPTTTPITGTAGALTTTLQVPYVWLT